MRTCHATPSSTRSPPASCRSACGAACAAISRAEIIGDSGFDWILLDTEHSPNEIPDLVGQLQAMQGGTATPIVRPAWNDVVLIKRCLDIGAQTLLLPYVQNAEEAKRAVAATRYPPHGIRGVAVGGRASRYGRVTDYLKKADAEICLLVQVETRERARPARGHRRGRWRRRRVHRPVRPVGLARPYRQPAHPEAQKAMQDAAKRLKKVGKPAGILTGNEEGTPPLYRLGLSIRGGRPFIVQNVFWIGAA